MTTLLKLYITVFMGYFILKCQRWVKNQMRLIAMSYNFMRVFEEVSKQQEPELIHPSDEQYRKTLEKRRQTAKKHGCFVNPLLFQPRIVRISSYTIRVAQRAIIAGKLLVSFMRKLVARLVPGTGLMVEH